MGRAGSRCAQPPRGTGRRHPGSVDSGGWGSRLPVDRQPQGRLVPTEAELARQEDRDYEPASVLLERIRTERETSFFEQGGKKYKRPAPPAKEHWDGVIPDSWTLSSLEDTTSATRTIRYGTLMPKENVGEGVLYVKVRDMKQDKIDLSSLHRITHQIASKYQNASLCEGDIPLSIRGKYGRVVHVPAELNGENTTQDTARLALLELVSREYVALYFRNPDAQNYFKRVAKGVAVKGVNISDVRVTPIALPPRTEQDRIVTEVERIVTLIDQLERTVEVNLKRCEALRQSVLCKAFTGGLMA